MSKVKIAGLENWELPEGGQSREAKEATKFRKERGLDGVSIKEVEPEDRKLQRQKNLFETMRWDCKEIDEKLKPLKEKSDLKGKDLNPLGSEIKKLQKDFREFKMLVDLRGMRENRKAINGFKSVIQNKEGLKDIEGTLGLIESFYDGLLSAEELLKGLEEKGVFK
jgi:hypothetical protein